MKISDFESIESKLQSKVIQAHPPPLSLSPGKLFSGDYTGINFPVIFKQEYGKELADVINTGTPYILLVSDKFMAILVESAFTGWKTFEAKLTDKNGREIEGYHGLSITGYCGKIDKNKSEVVEKPAPLPGDPPMKYRRGLYVGLDEWDGTDLFSPEGTTYIVATKRVTDIIKSHKLTNLQFRNLADIESWIWEIVDK